MKIFFLSLIGAAIAFAAHPEPQTPSAQAPVKSSATNPNVEVQINHSTVIDLAEGFKRISVANGEIAEAVAVTSTELLINGKTAGETSLMLWDTKGARHDYTVHVLADRVLLNSVREQLVQESGPMSV